MVDFDNTIIEKGNYEVTNETIELMEKIKDDFIIYVVSNSLNDKKLKLVCKTLSIPYIGNSRKPLSHGYKRLAFKSIKNSEIAMIGDQLITDVWGANRMGYYSILVDPMVEKELIFTKFNRGLEKIIYKKNKKDIQRGKYYD